MGELTRGKRGRMGFRVDEFMARPTEHHEARRVQVLIVRIELMMDVQGAFACVLLAAKFARAVRARDHVLTENLPFDACAEGEPFRRAVLLFHNANI